MRVIRHSSAESFLAAAEAWLLAREAENNLVLGLALGWRGAAGAGRAAPWLITVHDGDRVAACALRTPPRALIVTRAEPGASQALLESLGAEAADLPRVVGPEPAAAELAALWSRASLRPARLVRRQWLYSTEELVPPVRLAPGRLRQAGEADFGAVYEMAAGFLRDTRTDDPTPPAELARSRLEAGQLFVWDDGRPVSMAGWLGSTPNGVRLSFVYTSPEVRGRGYASACVAGLTARLFGQGLRHVCLFADAADPAPNALYRKLGYRPLLAVTEHALAE